MMNFKKQFPVLSSQKESNRLSRTTENWELRTGFLSCCPLLRCVPQAAAFDKAVEIFGEIRGVIPGALQSLGHQKHVEARGIAVRRMFGQVFLEQSMTDSVDVLIHLQNLAGTLQIEIDESPINQVKHLPQA